MDQLTLFGELERGEESPLVINRQWNPSVIWVPSTDISVSYIDHLQRQSAEDLSFYPTAALEKALSDNHIISASENGEPAGYLWFGAVRTNLDITIYQAAIDYDLRRMHLGVGMVKQLEGIANVAKCSGIRLKCASSAMSNYFWQSVGFYCTAVHAGGIKRQRDINEYRKDFVPTQYPVVSPSTKQTDMRAYNQMKQQGVAMPSRFSRVHYGEHLRQRG